MVKHLIKNIAVYDMPVDGTKKILNPGESYKAELTDRLRYLIANKIFEDLGEVKDVAAKVKAKPKKEYSQPKIELELDSEDNKLEKEDE